MKRIHVYVPDMVAKVQQAHKNQIYEKALEFQTIEAHLNAYAQTLWEEVKKGSFQAYIQINNYHPNYLGKPVESLKKINLSLDDCQLTTANNFGFDNWDEVAELNNKAYNADFERAVNYIIRGEIGSLKEFISQNATLINMTSQYGHHATLLHYASSNGIEIWRQQVPNNLPEIIQLLLEMGADADAKMKVYGGTFNTLELLRTSAHPFEADVGDEAVIILEDSLLI